VWKAALPREALRRIPDRARIVVATQGCGTPRTLLQALAGGAETLRCPTLYSGLLLEYPFLDLVERGDLRYTTWLVQPPVRDAVTSGHVHYLPARASGVPRLVRRLR